MVLQMTDHQGTLALGGSWGCLCLRWQGWGLTALPPGNPLHGQFQTPWNFRIELGHSVPGSVFPLAVLGLRSLSSDTPDDKWRD